MPVTGPRGRVMRVTTGEEPTVSGETPAEQTKCEWCGAEYDAAARPPAPAHPHPRPTPVTEGEPVTHCEWCGAEYPLPEASRES